MKNFMKKIFLGIIALCNLQNSLFCSEISSTIEDKLELTLLPIALQPANKQKSKILNENVQILKPNQQKFENLKTQENEKLATVGIAICLGGKTFTIDNGKTLPDKSFINHSRYVENPLFIDLLPISIFEDLKEGDSLRLKIKTGKFDSMQIMKKIFIRQEINDTKAFKEFTFLLTQENHKLLIDNPEVKKLKPEQIIRLSSKAKKCTLTFEEMLAQLKKKETYLSPTSKLYISSFFGLALFCYFKPKFIANPLANLIEYCSTGIVNWLRA